MNKPTIDDPCLGTLHDEESGYCAKKIVCKDPHAFDQSGNKNDVGKPAWVVFCPARDGSMSFGGYHRTHKSVKAFFRKVNQSRIQRS
jgi:hypothetical protein